MSKAKHTRGAIPIFCRFDKLLDASKLRPNPVNPYKHPKDQIDRLVAVIKANGWRNPIIVSKRSGLITKGHARHTAGLQLADTVPVEIQDYASEQKERDDLLADNRIAELAEADDELLTKLLKDANAESVAAAGYLPDEVDKLFKSLSSGAEIDAEPRIDEAGELKKQWKTNTGQLWQLGDHRLLCGDSTKEADVAALWADISPEQAIMVTDPPYGVNYDPHWRADAGVNKNQRKMGKIQNDDVVDWTPAWRLFKGPVAYIWHAGVHCSEVQASLESAGFKIRAQIIWAKDRMALSRGDYHWQHEPCWYAVREGQPGNRTDDRTQTTLWEIAAREDSGHGHGAQKPIECMKRPIQNHNFDYVYEPFCGTGTTILASENLKRICRAMEIDPGYVAVSIQRWVDATGKKPKLLT